MANVLIVDDQQCIRELLSEKLICEGYRVTTARSAESLMGHLRSSRFDLVLLDLYLGRSDGLVLLSDIKREYPDLPVLIVTAYDSFADDPRLSEAAGYVVKSTNLDELKEKMTDLLRNQGGACSEIADRPDVRQVNLLPVPQRR